MCQYFVASSAGRQQQHRVSCSSSKLKVRLFKLEIKIRPNDSCKMRTDISINKSRVAGAENAHETPRTPSAANSHKCGGRDFNILTVDCFDWGRGGGVWPNSQQCEACRLNNGSQAARQTSNCTRLIYHFCDFLPNNLD